MTETSELKKQLRSRLREARATRMHDEHFSKRLSTALGQLCLDLKVNTVAAYFPIQGEPDIREFLDWALGNQVRVILPSVRGEALHWVGFDGSTEFGELGFEEGKGPAAKLTQADLVFVPALAVDLKGNRLGKGKGYYDRALSELASLDKRRPKVVAVVFDDEVLLEVPAEPHDQKVDGVITAGKLLWF